MDTTTIPLITTRLPGWKIGSARRYIEQGYSDLAIHTFAHISVEQVVALRMEMELKKGLGMDTG